jgi:ectoine hydroxylase-related dioxygenase (phytanoyl-CoA dioxygenase family)
MSVVNYSDLNMKGFVVVPNVIGQEDIDRVLVDYEKVKQGFQQKGNVNQNYNMLYGGPHRLGSKLAPVVDCINNATGMDIDIIASLGSYFDSSILRFDWHQDHEPCFMWQMSNAYVNFWIPLIKPNRSEAGLRIVPFDILREKTSPQFMEQHVLNKGAQSLRSINGVTTIVNADVGTQTTVNVSFDEVCVVPEVAPGDAVIMRGDLIHETQRTHTHRVAISVKALNCRERVVTREKFLTNSRSKMETVAKNKNDYAYHLQKFNVEGVDSFRLRELFPRAPIHYSMIV